MSSRCKQSAIGRYNSRKTKAQLIEELESLQVGNDELKHTLRDLRENHDLAQNAAREIVWDWSEKTGIFSTSPGARNKLGLADLPRRVTLKKWKDIIHTDDVDRFWAVLMAYLKGDTDLYEYEYRIRQKDGSYKWVCGQGLALRDQNGRVYRMAGTISDITERKRTVISRWPRGSPRKTPPRFAPTALHRVQSTRRFCVVEPAGAAMMWTLPISNLSSTWTETDYWRRSHWGGLR